MEINYVVFNLESITAYVPTFKTTIPTKRQNSNRKDLIFDYRFITKQQV